MVFKKVFNCFKTLTYIAVSKIISNWFIKVPKISKGFHTYFTKEYKM